MRRVPRFPHIALVQWIILTPDQVALAVHRYEEHGNSAPRLSRFLRKSGDGRLLLGRALRRVERRFEIDLGILCFKFVETETRTTPEVQQRVMDYVAYRRAREDGGHDLVVSVDRAREIDRLARGEAWLSLHDS